MITCPTFDDFRSEAPPKPITDILPQVSNYLRTGDISKTHKIEHTFEDLGSETPQNSITDILHQVRNSHTTEDIAKTLKLKHFSNIWQYQV